MHYSERWKPKRKVYCAITSTGVAHYHSATDRYKPIGARSFSAFDCKQFHQYLSSELDKTNAGSMQLSQWFRTTLADSFAQ